MKQGKVKKQISTTSQIARDPVPICADILRQYGAKRIYLFGSRARGNFNPDSDIDLAVEGLPSEKFLRVLADLWDAAGGRVDLVLLDDGSPFAEHIKEKIKRGWAKLVS